MNRDGPIGTFSSRQMLAWGKPEANRICILSVPRAGQPPLASKTPAAITRPPPAAVAAAAEAVSMFVASV